MKLFPPRSLLLALLLPLVHLISGIAQHAEPLPVGAWHQHLISPTTSQLWSQPVFDAKTLIGQLDDAGIRRGAVLSVAYLYGDDRQHIENEEAKVRAENDWTSQQVSLYPGRLVGFCGVNPLQPYALAEFKRCSSLPGMIGLKLHFGNSGVSLRNPEHLREVQAIFRAASARRMPIVVHMRARSGQLYGRVDAQIFLESVLPSAPDSVVQIAHLAGAGPGYPDYADEAMGVFADAVAAHDPRTIHVIFDVTTVVTPETTPDNAALIVKRMRQVGLNRILFGTDLSISGNPPPKEQWQTILQKLPLTQAEFSTLASNVPAYAH